MKPVFYPTPKSRGEDICAAAAPLVGYKPDFSFLDDKWRTMLAIP